MPVTWPHIRKKPKKHGWCFSAFAAIFAVASINGIQLLVSVPSTNGIGEFFFDLYFAACAFAAARVAGRIARVLGAEDYGWVAGAITAPLFLGFLLSPLAVLKGWSDLPALSEMILYFSVLVALPFCMLGTAVFIGGLRLLRWSGAENWI
jgi:hypothetical protein